MNDNIVKSVRREFINGTITNHVDYENEYTLCETPLSIANKLLNMTAEQRMEVFSYFCIHCGSGDKCCQCWNDD